RFTASSMFTVDVLSRSALTPEIQKLREEFLQGKRPYFDVQLSTLAFLKVLYDTEPKRFEEIKPLLAEADRKAKEAVGRVLEGNGVKYTVSENPLYGITEGTGSFE